MFRTISSRLHAVLAVRSARKLCSLSLHFRSGDRNGIASAAERDAVYVVLGWLGAKPKHVNKVLSWYQQRGLDTLACIPPISALSMPPVASVLSRRAAQTIVEYTPRPLFFHVFSGNGLYCMTRILHDLLTDPVHPEDAFRQRARLKGLVIDSAPPVRINAPLLARALTHVTLSCPGQHEPRYGHPVLTPMFRTLAGGALALPGMQQRADSFMHTVNYDLPAVPMHLFYSTADKLIPPEDVEQFAALQTEQGKIVTKTRFDKSFHAAHFKMYQQQYTDQLERFYASCLTFDGSHRRERTAEILAETKQ